MLICGCVGDSGGVGSRVYGPELWSLSVVDGSRREQVVELLVCKEEGVGAWGVRIEVEDVGPDEVPR